MSWRNQAACHPLVNAPADDLWHEPDTPGKGTATDQKDRIAAAKAVCADCPVREACAQEAIETRIPDGVWGGMTFAERKQTWSKQQKRPINHGHTNGAKRHRDRGEKPCEECLAAERAYEKSRRERRRAKQAAA